LRVRSRLCSRGRFAEHRALRPEKYFTRRPFLFPPCNKSTRVVFIRAMQSHRSFAPSAGPADRVTISGIRVARPLRRLAWFALVAFLPALAAACEIKFGVDDTSQGPYPAGATVIFRLRVDLTHQNCPVEMKDTKIQGIGVNILGATPWQSPSPNVWERRVKVVIASPPGGKVTLTAKRSCEKDGGWGAYAIEARAVKL
jgi:hypothetical protein